MATMNVSLPDTMKDWVEAQVASGHYANVSDFVRDMIRRQMERMAAQENFDRLIDETEASGFVERTKDQLMASARAAARRQGLID